MAKKGQAVQLQQELNHDEDWDKMMQKDGLIVVDIYSEWCGPCSAMTANLKKLKLEIGGDNLHLAIAKSDNISYLERFRNKSEPTWMFIAGSKMVNLMFGANAPKLVRLIIQELKNEADVRDGNRERGGIEVTELAPEEKLRYDAAKRIEEEAIKIEIERREQLIREKRLTVANVVLEHIGHFGVVLVLPHAKQQALSTLAEYWNPAGLAISATEKVQLTEETIEELLYFADTEFSKQDKYNLINAPGLAYLIKPVNLDEYTGDIDQAVLEIVYGSSKCLPGCTESPAQILMVHLTRTEMQIKLTGGSKSSFQQKIAASKKPAEDAEEQKEEEEVLKFSGLWAPPNKFTKAIAIKLLFPKVYDPIALPEPPPVPPHVAAVYEAFKRREVFDLISEFREDVIRYGFFTDDNPETAKLIAKTLPMFEKAFAAGTTYGEKLVVQLSKKRSEPLLAFLELGPTFISSNSVEGEKHCKLFFPADYDTPEGQRGAAEVKKKKKKGKKAKEAAMQQETLAEGEHGADETGITEEEAEGEQAEGEGEGESDGEGEGIGEGEGETDENAPDEETLTSAEAVDTGTSEGADKATSPMPDE